MKGTVKFFSGDRGYGFITREDGVNIFVHFTGIAGRGHKNLNEGQKVEFGVEATDRGPKAVRVKVVGWDCQDKRKGGEQGG